MTKTLSISLTKRKINFKLKKTKILKKIKQYKRMKLLKLNNHLQKRSNLCFQRKTWDLTRISNMLMPLRHALTNLSNKFKMKKKRQNNLRSSKCLWQMLVNKVPQQYYKKVWKQSQWLSPILECSSNIQIWTVQYLLQ